MDSKSEWIETDGFQSEHDIDSRWVLSDEETGLDTSSLRIFSAPDLPPGYLRAVWIVIKGRRKRTDSEIQDFIEENQFSEIDIEYFGDGVEYELNTETIIYEDSLHVLEEMFDVELY